MKWRRNKKKYWEQRQGGGRGGRGAIIELMMVLDGWVDGLMVSDFFHLFLCQRPFSQNSVEIRRKHF